MQTLFFAHLRLDSPLSCTPCRADDRFMILLGLFLLSPIRFEYMVSTLGLRCTDALARVAAGTISGLTARLTSQRVRRFSHCSPRSIPCANTPRKFKIA